MHKYKILKDLDTPFYKVSKGEIYTVYEWMDFFGYDWVSNIQKCITENTEWFELV